MNLKPPVKGNSANPSQFCDTSLAKRAIETAREVLNFIEFSPPILRKTPHGEVSIEIPLMYNGYAIDRVHYDPQRRVFIPKGAPHHIRAQNVNLRSVIEESSRLLEELSIVEAVEYRGPEEAWVVPISWNVFIIAHIKITHDGKEIIPDYKLTEEVKKNVI